MIPTGRPHIDVVRARCDLFILRRYLCPMIENIPAAWPLRFGFILTQKFSLISLSSAVEALRLSNRHLGEVKYEWALLSLDGAPVTASAGLQVNCDMRLDAWNGDALVVCSGLDVERNTSPELVSALRKIARTGKEMGALCTGAHVLAKAGLLEDHNCTLHWENLPGFTETFPDVQVSNELFEIDRNRFTCAGGTASLDMMLNIISKHLGMETAAWVADQCMHDRIRDKHDQQKITLPQRLGVRHPKLLSVIKMMEENLEEPYSRTDLARTAALSTRQLERLFRKYLNRSPARYYLELRLNRSRLLLLQTDMPIIDVAMACGFVSASHFSKCYRDFYGKTPRKERGLPSIEM